MARGGKGQPSPNVKGHRKRYSQLGLDLSSAESGDGEEEEEEGEEEEEEEEVGQTYFTNHQVTVFTALPVSQSALPAGCI